MAYHHGYLLAVDQVTGITTEIFNHARTLEAISSAQVAGGADWFSDINWASICEAYYWMPDCDTADLLTAHEFGLPDQGTQAPWFDATHSNSGEGLGFWIEEWTGLDSEHVARQSFSRGGPAGGSSLGAASAKGRTMAFNVMLFGLSDAGLEHMFRWLEGVLNSMFDSAGLSDLLIRRNCPEVALNGWEGMARLESVGMLTGLRWEAPPLEGGGCVARLASFVVEAEDPCMYVEHLYTPGAAVVYDPTDANMVELRSRSCSPDCGDTTGLTTIFKTGSVISNRPAIGAIAPIIDLSFTPRTGQSYVHGGETLVQIYADPDGTGVFSCTLPLLAEWAVRSIAETDAVTDLKLRYDGNRHEILESSAETLGWQPGMRWTRPTGGRVPRWASRRCYGFFVALLPFGPCIGERPPKIGMSLAIGERLSCT